MSLHLLKLNMGFKPFITFVSSITLLVLKIQDMFGGSWIWTKNLHLIIYSFIKIDNKSDALTVELIPHKKRVSGIGVALTNAATTFQPITYPKNYFFSFWTLP